MNCINCGLQSNPMKSVDLSGFSSKHYKVAIIRDNPDLTETVKGLFTSAKSQVVVKALKQLGYTPEDTLFTYVCKCAAYNDRPPSYIEMECCKERLFRELKDAGAERCLLMGLNTIKSFTGKETLREDKMRGVPFYHKDTNTWCVPTYDPGKALHFPDNFTDIVYDMRKLNWENYLFTPTINKKIIIETEEQFTDDIFGELLWNEKLTLDIETNTLNRYQKQKVVGGLVAQQAAKVLSICISTPDNYCVDIAGELLHSNKHIRDLVQQLFNANIKWVGHTAIAFDAPFLKEVLGLEVEITDDILLKHYAYDERGNIHKLEQQAQSLLGVAGWKHMVKEYIIDDGATYDNIPRDILYEYNALDNIYTTALDQLLTTELANECRSSVVNRLHTIAPILVEMESNGVLIDRDYLWKTGAEWELEACDLENELKRITGNPNFKPNSYVQVGNYIYDTLGMKPIPGKGRSTKKEVLEELNEIYDNTFLNTIVKVRHIRHIKSTFIEGILKRLTIDNILRLHLDAHKTVTGRLSSSLHNIPKRLGKTITYAFKARPGKVLMNADFSQMELRVMAWYSNEPLFINAFNNNIDVHTATAAGMFNTPIEEVTPEQRFSGKTINFAVGYGMQYKSLAAKLKKSEEVAKEYIKNYYESKPKYTIWKKGVEEFCKENQYVKTPEPFGRIRHFPLRTRENWMAIERECVNTMVQSVASDMCLDAIIRLYNVIKTATDCMKDVKLLFTIHDSVLLECPEENVNEIMKQVKSIMEYIPPELNFPVPLKVDIEYGPRWGELRKGEDVEEDE